jgi:hypothetical protein
MRFGSVRFESMGAEPLASAGCPDTDASFARGGAFAGSRADDTAAAADEALVGVASRTIHASTGVAEREGVAAAVPAGLLVDGAAAGLTSLSEVAGATRGGCAAGLSDAPAGLGRTLGGARSPPPGGGLDPVTAAFPLL